MKEILKIPIKANLYRHQQNACRFACERFGIHQKYIVMELHC